MNLLKFLWGCLWCWLAGKVKYVEPKPNTYAGLMEALRKELERISRYRNAEGYKKIYWDDLGLGVDVPLKRTATEQSLLTEAWLKELQEQRPKDD